MKVSGYKWNSATQGIANRWVKAHATVGDADYATDDSAPILGVMLNNPRQGEACEIAGPGEQCEVMIADSCVAENYATATTAGKSTDATTATVKHVGGIYENTVTFAANERAKVRVNPIMINGA